MLKIPARHDHVGSFLRPEYLLQARAQKAKGEINAEQLRAVDGPSNRRIVRPTRPCTTRAQPWRAPKRRPLPTALVAAAVRTPWMRVRGKRTRGEVGPPVVIEIGRKKYVCHVL